MRYVACRSNEEGTILYHGEGKSPQDALKDYLDNMFNDQFDGSVEVGSKVEVSVHEVIEPDTPEWEDEFDPSWSFALGKELGSLFVTYPVPVEGL